MKADGSDFDRLLLDQIADRWSILVLGAICASGGILRFNALRRQVSGVSQKTLTQCVRRLERNGIVERRIIDGAPPGVAYAVTPLGRSLDKPFAALNAWTSTHADAVRKAQRAFERAVWGHSRVRLGGAQVTPVLRQNLGRWQVVDLSALIRRESRLDDHPLVPPASTPPVPLRRPSPARPREPRLAPPARRVQEDEASAQASHDGSPLLARAGQSLGWVAAVPRDRNPATVLRWQRRRGETTDTATDDGHSESIRAHGLLRPRTQNKGHVRHQHELGRGLPPEPPRDLIAARGGFMAVHAVATSLLSTRDNFEERASIRSGALML